MPECKACEGAGEVVRMPDGTFSPYYRVVQSEGYPIPDVDQRKVKCAKCDGWGRVDDEPTPPLTNHNRDCR